MYNFKDFEAQFPDDAACLHHIFRARFAGHVCECGKSNCFYRVAKRCCYACSFCGAQLHPTAGTIFHKSETSLKSWFFAIFLFAKSKNGVAAKELERQLGVTYKTAFRMAHKIRELMASGGNMLTGVVEADETYIGGRRTGLRGRDALGKTPVIGVVERRGEVRATVVANVTANNAVGHIRRNVETTAQVVTDELPVYNYTAKFGFKHIRVNHGAGEYVIGRAHTNTGAGPDAVALDPVCDRCNDTGLVASADGGRMYCPHGCWRRHMEQFNNNQIDQQHEIKRNNSGAH